MLASRGYNPGGTTISFDTGAQDVFGAERLWNYELFLRGRTPDGRLSFNANAFFADYEDAQRPTTTLGPSGLLQTVFDDAEDARAYGLELELAFRPSPRLSLRGGLGLLETDLRRFSVSAAGVEGNDFQRSPGLTGFLTASWTPVDRFTLDAQGRYGGGYYGDDANTRAFRSGDLATVDAGELSARPRPAFRLRPQPLRRVPGHAGLLSRFRHGERAATLRRWRRGALLMPARRLLARLHAWIGAVAAPVLLLVCLSGAALAFDAELFRAQHPFVRSVDGAAARVVAPRVDAWLAAAKRGYGRSFQPLGLFLPDSRVEVDTAMFYGLRSGAGGLEDTVILVVDPATGAYRGDFLLDSAWGHQLIHFHHQLFAGEVGAAIVALLGLLLAAFAATGLYLWWPRRGSAWRKARPPHLSGRPLGRWYRIHGWIGFWSALPILFFGLTGTAASHSGWFGGLLAGLPYDVPAALAPAFASTCAGRVTTDEAVAAASAALPGQRLATVGLPDGTDPYRLTFKTASPFDHVEGDTLAFVHATCPGVVRPIDARQHGPRAAIGQAMLSLHAGRSLGRAGDPLVVFAGLAAAVLAGSGLYIWVARHLTCRRTRHSGRTMAFE